MTCSDRDVLDVFEKNPDLLNLGDETSAPGADWEVRAEDRLNIKFSASYRWFIRNFGGGDIGGDEIYSIYGIDFDEVVGGDIVRCHEQGGVVESISEKYLRICDTDYGEIFFFDCSRMIDDEYVVMRHLTPDDIHVYAKNMYEFLAKRVIEYGGVV
jgi:hypothetical protein